MSKPSVLIINRVYPPTRGATGRIVQDLAHALEHSGWRVSILTTQDKRGQVQRKNVTVYGVKKARKSKSAVGGMLNLLRLLRAGLRIPKHDIVITLTDPPMLIVVGRLISKLKGVSHIHWSQDLYPDLFKPLGVKVPSFFDNFMMKLSRRCLKKTDRTVVIGRCMADYLVKTGVPKQNVKLIANWADFEVVAPSGKEKYDMLDLDPTGIAKRPEEMFRDDSPKFRVLYAGNIGRAHPMRSVIEAAALLKDHSEIEFVFVGDKNVHSILSRERGTRELTNIKFMPYQPIEKLRDVMESGDIHLVTMRNDAQNLLVPCKFYSGLTVGRPTIFVGPEGSEVGQVINEYGAGKIVPVGDAKALADAIYAYRMDGGAWFAAQEGALRASQAYHPNTSLHKWVELLEKVRNEA